MSAVWYLLVVPTGAKLWRFKYQFEGRDQCLGLGRYGSWLSCLDSTPLICEKRDEHGRHREASR
jgi:hypothetical protein